MLLAGLVRQAAAGTRCGRCICVIALLGVAGTFASAQAVQSAAQPQDDGARGYAPGQDVNPAVGKQTAEARRMLLKGLDTDPASVPMNLALGDLLRQDGRYPEAMDRYETILATAPAHPGARAGELTAAVALAASARSGGHGEAALLCLRHAREFLPADPTLLTDLGIQALDLHQLAMADEALTLALSLQPGSTTALYALGRVELEQGRTVPAEQHLRGYLQAVPGDASAHYGLGHLLQMELRNDEATKEFQQSIALQPAQTESSYQLGMIALNAGRDEEARTLFESVLARSSSHGGALTGLGILLFRTKQYVAARGQLVKAVSTAPSYQPAHYYLGLTLAKLGDREGSRYELDQAVRLDREHEGKSLPRLPER